jgi:hypothetical protein
MNTQPFSSTFTPLASPQQVPLPRTTTRRPLRLGVVGVGSSHECAGGHIARHLASLGAELAAVADPQRDVLSTVRQQVRETGGEPNTYTEVEAMLAHEGLDAVAICSPVQSHRKHLRSALASGVHVLCEKPLLLESGRDPVADARPLVEGFAQAGKVLMLNEPWPYTLAFFDELYPEARIYSRPPQHLAVLLCPCTPGFEMISSSVPHALSLLFALCPPRGLVERLRVEANDARDGGSRFSRGESPASQALRACTTSAATPARSTTHVSASRASSGSCSSIPMRHLTVTGMRTAATMAATQSPTNAGSAIRQAPKRPSCTRSDGQPTLRLTSS